MQSAWQIDERNNIRQVPSDYDFTEFERSISAPPPETSLLFTSRNNDNADSVVNKDLSFSSLPDDQNILSGSSTKTISNHHQQQRKELAPPGFATSFLQSSTSQKKNISNETFPDRGIGVSTRTQIQDRRTIGENLARPHSAAPSFENRRSAGLPPVLLSRQETPLRSNISVVQHASTTINDMHYLEDTYIDRSQILQLGQRRPSSTGVIGGNHQGSSSTVLNSLGIAVRPAAKTLMDLIQEDYPRESQAETTAAPINSVLYDTTAATAFQSRRAAASAPERPRTTSPLSSQYMRDDYDSIYGHSVNDLRLSSGVSVQRSIDLTQRRNDMNSNDILDSMNQLSLSIDETTSYRTNNAEQSRPIPRYATVDRCKVDNNAPGSFHAPVACHPQPSRSHTINLGEHSQYNPQNGGRYGTQPQQTQTNVQTHFLPSGHTVYINTAPPPPQYGYATIQYHPHPRHHQHQHASHTVPSGGPPPGEQYISVIPIQAGRPPTDPRGTYTYWQPPTGLQGSSSHTVTIIPTGSITPMKALQRIGESKLEKTEPQHQKQKQRQATTHLSHGGRGKEKNGKNRRNSGGSRRGAGSGGVGVGSCRDTKLQTITHLNSNASLLEDYKTKKNNRDWIVDDVEGHVVEFCKDQNGSRFIQQRLEIGDENEKEIVMTEVLPEVDRLRNDVFGNYVVQKLWDFGNKKMREDLRNTMVGEMVQLSMQMYGCRVVQKVLECIDEIYLADLLSEFQNNVLSLIHDQNGNHVIQKCIEVMSRKAKAAQEENEEEKALFFGEKIDFIVNDVLDNLSTLACHPYGCRVLQRILEYSVEDQKDTALENISRCLRKLFDDQYGNYVIQHVLQFGRVKDRDMVLEMVTENGLLKLSRQKYASNVVEKLLKYGNAEQRKSIVREMLRIVDEKTDTFVEDETKGTSVVLLMVRDPYANYVVQTTLDVVPDSEEKEGLLEELNAHSTELKNYTFAKHIITKLDS